MAENFGKELYNMFRGTTDSPKDDAEPVYTPDNEAENEIYTAIMDERRKEETEKEAGHIVGEVNKRVDEQRANERAAEIYTAIADNRRTDIIDETAEDISREIEKRRKERRTAEFAAYLLEEFRD